MIAATLAEAERPDFAGANEMQENIRVRASAFRPFVRAVVAATLKEALNHPDVEDCAHEVFARLVENERAIDPTTLRGWLAGTARHVALDA